MIMEKGVNVMKYRDLEDGLLMLKAAHDFSTKMRNEELLVKVKLLIGSGYESRGDSQRALIWYNQARELLETTKLRKALALCYVIIGELHRAQGDYHQVLNWFDKARVVQEELNSQKQLSFTYNILGLANHSLDQHKEALIWYGKAMKVQEQLGIEPDLARSYNNIGEVHRSRGHYEEAIKWYSQAREIHERTGQELALATTLNNIGGTYFLLGQYKDALKGYHQALEIQKKLGKQHDLARSYNNIGSIAQTRGDYNGALEWYTKAKDIQEELGAKDELSRFYNNIGGLNKVQGNFDEALKYYNQAREIQEQLGLRRDLATSFSNIGQIYRSRGNFDEALEWHMRAKEIREEINLDVDLARSYNAIGGIHHLQGRYEEGLKWYLQAKDIQEELKLKVDLAATYVNVGGLHKSQGKYETALEWYDQARKIQKSLGLEMQLATTSNNIGGIYLDQNDYDQALKWFHKAKYLRQKLGRRLDLADSYNNIFIAFYEAGQLDSTFFYAQRSIELNEELRQLNAGQINRRLFVSRSQGAIEAGLISAFALKKKHPAFVFSEKGKARSLSDLLAERSIKSSDIPPSMQQSDASLKNQLKAIEQELSFDISITKRKNLTRERDQLYENWQELKDQMKLEAPEYASLVYPQTIECRQLQSILEKEEVVVSYFTGHLQTYVFVITPSTIQMIDLGRSDSLNQLVEDFRTEFILSQKASIERNDPLAQLNLDRQFFDLSHRLHQKLWSPIDSTDLLKGKNVILIPDGFLNYLPFDLLIKDSRQKAYQDYRYLIVDHPISYYPSATLLHFERTNKIKYHSPKKDFFGLGVSQFNNTNCTNDGKIYDDLSTITASVDQLSKIFASDRSATTLNAAASEYAFKSLDLASYRYLHFATHGVINTEAPDFSSILLQSTVQEDGCLSIHEIFDLDFNADLVTLAACQTGLGKLVRGEGMVGFTRALMYAGTPSVILSLWEVADESTNQLFLDYYSTLAKDGSDKYVPLRATQLKMIESEEYANPYYWSPFVFIGARESKF